MAAFLEALEAELEAIREADLDKVERPITTPQRGAIGVRADGHERRVINLCANNYLGLADHPALIDAAKDALDRYGLGMASVRFICGTQDQHRALEAAIADFLGTADSILYAACFDANGGVFEPLFGEDDGIISDALNHASIIDGVRLCKARRYRFANRDMDELETRLGEAREAGARRIVVVTDGVFSMDGYLADLATMRALCDRFEAALMVDDCHATGVLGPEGRGTPAHFGIEADIVTSTLGKALGGSAGGFTAAAAPVVEMLRQRSRPYLFSNALPPPIVGAAIRAVALVREGDERRARLQRHARRFREGLEAAGFELLPGEHPIIPVMLGEAGLAKRMAAGLFEKGVYVTGFSYPVVPKGQARIRTQMSAALEDDHIERALEAFSEVGRELGVAR